MNLYLTEIETCLSLGLNWEMLVNQTAMYISVVTVSYLHPWTVGGAVSILQLTLFSWCVLHSRQNVAAGVFILQGNLHTTTARSIHKAFTVR